jgi:inner membrane protein
MFNSTHTFVGFAVAKLGADKWVRYGTATAVIASNLPDIDSIAALWGFAAYLEHHRGITHSIFGVPILALLFSCAMYFFSANFGRTYVVALIAMATHPALDYLTSWGLRPFLPFNGTLYYGDVVFIFDPYLDAVLLLGLLTAWLWPKRKRVVTATTILIALGYVVGRIELHRLAAARVAEIVKQKPEVEKWAVLPRALRLRLWMVLTASKTGVSKMDICGVPCPAVETEMIPIMGSAPRSELVVQASMTESAATLLQFARFPVTRVQAQPSGYRVMFIEAGFLGEGGNTAVAAVITLDKAVQVVSESLSFDQTID